MAVRKKLPPAEQEVKDIPSTDVAKKELPKIGIPENIVMINGTPVEIKPTK